MSALPRLRHVVLVGEPPEDARLRILPGGDHVLAHAFGTLLANVRAGRGFRADELVLFAPAGDPAGMPPKAPNGFVWAPHVVAAAGRPALVWEAASPLTFEAVLDAPADELAIWSGQPSALLRLAALALTEGTEDGGYLSLRWLLAHRQVAAAAASADVAFEHVSVHATPQEMTTVRAVLRDALGLVEVLRPSTISTPGHWLTAGPVRVHLNAREGIAPPAAGSAPNHICFAVADLDAAEAAVEERGFACERAGSLDRQVWFRLQSGTVIELQPRRA